MNRNGDGPGDHVDDDPVERNRTAPRRHTHGRAPTGWPMTRRLTAITAAAIVVATVVLVAVLASSG